MDDKVFVKEFSKAELPLLDILIKRHFLDIEGQICSATSCKEAEIIAGDAFQGFRQECMSEIINLFSQNISMSYWNNAGPTGDDKLEYLYQKVEPQFI